MTPRPGGTQLYRRESQLYPSLPSLPHNCSYQAAASLYLPQPTWASYGKALLQPAEPAP